jgi:hypothetical protein
MHRAEHGAYAHEAQTADDGDLYWSVALRSREQRRNAPLNEIDMLD